MTEKPRKALVLASVASMIDQFNIPNIKLLQSLGYSVDVIANFTEPGNITKERSEELIDYLNQIGVRATDIQIPRTLDLFAIVAAYKNIKKLMIINDYSLVHCHSPIGAAIARLAAKDLRKKGTKIIYTAHGFHFYKGAPLLNWVVYYPIEKWLSKYTDVLVTINKEDYRRAEEKFHANKTIYVPGIGVDINKYAPNERSRKKIRQDLGLTNDRIMLLSVGELNENKNHETVIRAIAGMDITYVIVGKGELKNRLETVAANYGVDLRLSGYIKNVSEYYNAADVYVLPSIREGLNVSLMEAMACGLPCCASRIRGNTDLIDNNGGELFDPLDCEDLKSAIIRILRSHGLMGLYNREKIKSFSDEIVLDEMKKVYEL